MAQDIYYPSITEIYRALMGKNGPYAYVPKLHTAIQKLYDQPGQKNLDAAKKITTNPTIHKLLDAINESNANGWRDNEDTFMDIQYGIIATLVKDEYTQLPHLVHHINDEKLKYDVLSFYETKYTDPEYIKKFDVQPINKQSHQDVLARTIIRIELEKLSNKTTSDAEVRKILGNLHKTMKLPRFRKQKAYLLASIFNILEEKIKTELSKPTPSEHKIDSVYIAYAQVFSELFDDKEYASEVMAQIYSAIPPSKHKVKSERPNDQDAYDKLKSQLGRGIDKLKKKTTEFAEQPAVQKARNQTGEALESATRATVNAIDAGIKKIKKKATRKNFDAAIKSIKSKWEEFLAQIEKQDKKMARN